MRTLLVVAGLPSGLGSLFVQGIKETLPVLAWLPLSETEPYASPYVEKLYRRMCAKLRKSEKQQRDSLLAKTRLIALYADRGDASEAPIFDRFGIEALVTPFGLDALGEHPRATRNQRGRAANELVRDARRAINHAKVLLDGIAGEVTNRDSRTCLLLPQKTFGPQMGAVFDYLKNAALSRMGKEQFGVGLKRLSEQMPKRREGNRQYYVNQNKMLFKSPTKSGPRHGFAPIWNDPGHEPSCVMRGRLRCGASFDPRVHYDCSIPSGHGRILPNCHGDGYRIPKARNHVNVAPNDHVR